MKIDVKICCYYQTYFFWLTEKQTKSKTYIAGLIPQSLQLRAQKTLASLGWMSQVGWSPLGISPKLLIQRTSQYYSHIMTVSSHRKLMARHTALTSDTFCIAALKRNIGDWEHFQDCCAEVDGTWKVKSSRKKRHYRILFGIGYNNKKAFKRNFYRKSLWVVGYADDRTRLRQSHLQNNLCRSGDI